MPRIFAWCHYVHFFFGGGRGNINSFNPPLPHLANRLSNSIFFLGGGNNNLYYFWPYICKPLLVIRCKINAKIELITCMIIDFFIGGGG